MPIQAITFDAAGTLIHLREPVGKTYSTIAAKFGIQASPSRIEAAFRTLWKRSSGPFSTESHDEPHQGTAHQGTAPFQAPTKPQADGDVGAPGIATKQPGSISEPTLSVRETNPEREWWKSLVHEVIAEAADTHGNHFEEFFTELYDHFENPTCWQLDPDAISVFQHCAARGLKIGLLSNFDYRLRTILTGLKILPHFDAVILSGEIQASKPDPGMFASIQHALQIGDPATILHVGDDPECDIAGAEQFGFRAFRVKHGKIPLRDVIKQLD